jgi:transcriptional regulator with XRE-family HTH domain
MQGYSIKMAKAMEQADGDMLGVQLGRACLARDISVIAVASALGVSRTAVYNLFLGVSKPKDATAERIREYLAQLG